MESKEFVRQVLEYRKNIRRWHEFESSRTRIAVDCYNWATNPFEPRSDKEHRVARLLSRFAKRNMDLRIVRGSYRNGMLTVIERQISGGSASDAILRNIKDVLSDFNIIPDATDELMQAVAIRIKDEMLWVMMRSPDNRKFDFEGLVIITYSYIESGRS